jgi:hypothetical protein
MAGQKCAGVGGDDADVDNDGDDNDDNDDEG